MSDSTTTLTATEAQIKALKASEAPIDGDYTLRADGLYDLKLPTVIVDKVRAKWPSADIMTKVVEVCTRASEAKANGRARDLERCRGALTSFMENCPNPVEIIIGGIPYSEPGAPSETAVISAATLGLSGMLKIICGLLSSNALREDDPVVKAKLEEANTILYSILQAEGYDLGPVQSTSPDFQAKGKRSMN